MESRRFAVVTPKGGPKGEEDAVEQKKKKKVFGQDPKVSVVNSASCSI